MESVQTPQWRVNVAFLCAILLLVVWVAAPLHSHSDSAKEVCTVCQYDHSPADSTTGRPLVVPPARIITAAAPVPLTLPDCIAPAVLRGRAPPATA